MFVKMLKMLIVKVFVYSEFKLLEDILSNEKFGLFMVKRTCSN